MDSHKNHKKEKPSYRWPSVEWMLGHNECCSPPSLCSFPLCDLYEILSGNKKTEAGEMITPACELGVTP